MSIKPVKGHKGITTTTKTYLKLSSRRGESTERETLFVEIKAGKFSQLMIY